MTAPIDAAETALRAALAAALINAGALPDGASLADKPVNPVPPGDAPAGDRFAAALVRVGPRVRRIFIGGGGALYQLDALFNFEFAVLDSDAARRQALEGAVQDAVAAVLRDNPTLGGAVQRLDLEDAPELTDAPPASVITAIPLAASIQAGDAMGRTPAT